MNELLEFLAPEIQEIIRAISSQPGAQNPYLIELPSSDTVDLPIEELQSLVARTSNAYGRATRFAGMARAEAKLRKGAYDRKFKARRWGSNEAERDRNAMEACHDEHVAMIDSEAIAELADKFENGARVASESARKLLDTSKNMVFAQRREAHGALKDDDFDHKGYFT